MSGKITGLGVNFDATQVEPSKPQDTIPAGWYNCEITDGEVLATKGASAGTRYAPEFTVCDGEYKGRKFWGSINTKNKSAQAQEIGQKELSAICHATGVLNVSDVSVFNGKRLQVKVKVKPAEGEYDAKNEPKGFKPLEAGVSTGTPAFVPSAPGQPPAPPMAPPAPPQPPAPPGAEAWPPAGWQANPNAVGWFWNAATGDQKQEADLRALFPPAPVAAPAPAPMPPAPPVAPPPPVAPAAPPAPPMPPQAPVSAPFPPAGWIANPNAPGWFYEAANSSNQKQEAELRALLTPSAPPAAPAAPVGPDGNPVPPWQRPA